MLGVPQLWCKQTTSGTDLDLSESLPGNQCKNETHTAFWMWAEKFFFSDPDILHFLLREVMSWKSEFQISETLIGYQGKNLRPSQFLTIQGIPAQGATVLNPYISVSGLLPLY